MTIRLLQELSHQEHNRRCAITSDIILCCGRTSNHNLCKLSARDSRARSRQFHLTAVGFWICCKMLATMLCRTWGIAISQRTISRNRTFPSLVNLIYYEDPQFSISTLEGEMAGKGNLCVLRLNHRQAWAILLAFIAVTLTVKIPTHIFRVPEGPKFDLRTS